MSFGDGDIRFVRLGLTGCKGKLAFLTKGAAYLQKRRIFKELNEVQYIYKHDDHFHLTKKLQ